MTDERPANDWNEDRIGTLRHLWDEGYSTNEIGQRMGISKNAVVGKAHRLKLKTRPSPFRCKRDRAPTLLGQVGTPCATSAPSYPEGSPAAPASPVSVGPSSHQEETMSHRVSMLAPDRPCCWPIGEPGTRSFRYCDDVAIAGRPYCDEHAKLAYQRRAKRESGTAPLTR